METGLREAGCGEAAAGCGGGAGALAARAEALAADARVWLSGLHLEYVGWGLDELAAMLGEWLARGRGPRVSLTRWFEGVWVPGHEGLSGLRNYRSAMERLREYMGGEVWCGELSVEVMEGFVGWLAREGRRRAASMYGWAVLRVFNDARLWLNDARSGVVAVPDVLAGWRPPRQGPSAAGSRALDVETVRRLWGLRWRGDGRGGWPGRRDLALDCFRLSFALMGMGSADLLEARVMRGRTLVYNRAKTRDRRWDAARVEVEVPACAAGIVERWLDGGSGGRVFRFWRRYASAASFNRALNLGLKEVGEELGVEGLTFYAARHSMASLAVNGAGVDRWTVGAMLSHVAPGLAVTERYIARDWGPMNRANRRLMEWCFPMGRWLEWARRPVAGDF